MTKSVRGDPQHKYAREQLVQISIEDALVLGKVLALLPDKCATHNSIMYGCECGGVHMTTCEEIMQPLPNNMKRKLH